MSDISELEALHDEERRQMIARKALYKALDRMDHKPSEKQMHIILEIAMDAAANAWTEGQEAMRRRDLSKRK